jgi:hypothetical protein
MNRTTRQSRCMAREHGAVFELPVVLQEIHGSDAVATVRYPLFSFRNSPTPVGTIDHQP